MAQDAYPPASAHSHHDARGQIAMVWAGHECLIFCHGAFNGNLADTRLKWQGEHAGKWLSLAQAFSGIPQDPPIPGAHMIDETLR